MDIGIPDNAIQHQLIVLRMNLKKKSLYLDTAFLMFFDPASQFFLHPVFRLGDH